MLQCWEHHASRQCNRIYTINVSGLGTCGTFSSNFIKILVISWSNGCRIMTRYENVLIATFWSHSRQIIVNSHDLTQICSCHIFSPCPVIDESTIPSRSCEACIAAKQAHRSSPKEAEHRSKVPGERTVSDVRVESIGRWKYHIFFMDDCTRKSTTILTGKEEEWCVVTHKEPLNRDRKEI